ncbi:hypothetical protein K8R14_02610 [bacterium]|nr:hypothetical protein [bacterium]
MKDIQFSDEIKKYPILIVTADVSPSVQEKLKENSIFFLVDEEPLRVNGKTTDHVICFKDKDRDKVKSIFRIK